MHLIGLIILSCVMVYFYYMMPNFVFEGKIVLFVVFVWSAFRVQKYLVDNYYLVDQYHSSYYFVVF